MLSLCPLIGQYSDIENKFQPRQNRSFYYRVPDGTELLRWLDKNLYGEIPECILKSILQDHVVKGAVSPSVIRKLFVKSGDVPYYTCTNKRLPQSELLN